MCGTTMLVHSQCQHSERSVREGSKCAIGYANSDSTFHWEEAQGIVYADDLCHACRYRLAKYGTPDPNVSWVALKAILSKRSSTTTGSSTSCDDGAKSE
ncbi:hypothetical protein VSDG_05415 [Cytospora chrysosperma]|uniref:Uncharacterized protein n=1 Tax=Cytospora chrysosperma TaxID=252740 RepID=A0A423VZG3_CYTCH|nr:hypothetical protein VSDG_05415 [Valsa sordida]